MTAMAALFDLSGRTALITGGGSGLGAGMATALSDAGAAIVLVGRKEGRLTETLGKREGATVALDLAREGAEAELGAELDRKNIAPDIIVNSAGMNPRIHADKITADEWHQTIHINLTVPFLVARQFVPGMRKRKWGRIINIGSLQSSRAFENGIAYGSAKGGLTQLTRAMAEAWSADGINANALIPGFFPTELAAPVFDDAAKAASNARQTAIGRNGTLDDMRGAVVFFASDASAYITGQCLGIDGGFSAK